MLQKQFIKYFTWLSTLLLLSLSFPLSPAAESNGFKDISKGHTFYNEIEYLSGLGKVSGYTDGTFRSNEKITRGQAAKIISELLALDYDKSKVVSFTDVSKGIWYYDGVQALYQHKILSGYKGGLFKPIQTLTRAEGAKLISLAFKLSHDSSKDVQLTDVSKNTWSYPYIQRLLQNGVTKGTSKSQFSPTAVISRGEFTAFVARATKMATNQPVSLKKVEDVTDNSLTIEGKVYEVSKSLKGVFNLTNRSVLKNAKLAFKTEGNLLTEVTQLELTANGALGNEVVLDGQLSTFSGNVVINGDYIQLKNITLSGDLLISDGVKNSFTTDALTVKGKTEIKSGSTLAANARVSIANTKTRIKIVFNNSKVAVIEISKKDIELLARGETTITSLALSTDANIFADEGIIFPRIELKNGATEVQLNVTIKEIIIESNEEILLTGRGNIDTITINSDKKVAIQTTGQIGLITAVNKDSSLTIGENTQVKNMTLPEGKTASDVIGNYESIKGKVENIGGSVNPDYTPPFVGGGGSSAPPVAYFDAGALQGSSYGYAKLNIKNQKENTKVYYDLVKYKNNGEPTAQPAVVGSQAMDNLILSDNKEFILWNDYKLYVYQVDASGKILDAINVDVQFLWSTVQVNFDYSDRTITVETTVEKAENMTNVNDMFNQIFFYYSEEFYEFKQEQLNLVVWNSETKIPSFTIDMPVNMTADAEYFYFINFKGGNNFWTTPSSSSDYYDSTTINLLKRFSYNPEIKWYTYTGILHDYVKDDSGSSLVVGKESYAIKYRELISKGDSQKTLNSREDFINLVNSVNAELKEAENLPTEPVTE